MQRTLQPELLDALPVDHPAARHNRRDLRLTNLLLGTHRWLERTLRDLTRPGERVLEIGAGTGEFGRRLARRGILADGLDLWPRPADWPASADWHQEDLRTFAGFDRYAVVAGNLILHQFSAPDLAELGRRLARGPRVIVACEPVRRRASQLLYATLAPCLGANHVSLHDAHVSIAAGFRGDELERAMGLDPRVWHVRAQTTVLGIYRFVAVRHPA